MADEHGKYNPQSNHDHRASRIFEKVRYLDAEIASNTRRLEAVETALAEGRSYLGFTDKVRRYDALIFLRLHSLVATLCNS